MRASERPLSADSRKAISLIEAALPDTILPQHKMWLDRFSVPTALKRLGLSGNRPHQLLKYVAKQDAQLAGAYLFTAYHSMNRGLSHTSLIDFIQEAARKRPVDSFVEKWRDHLAVFVKPEVYALKPNLPKPARAKATDTDPKP